MVTEMIEKAIEIEGLLRIIRDGSPLPETYRLLKAKAAALAKEVDELKEEVVKIEHVKSQADIIIAGHAAIDDKPEVVFSDEPLAQPADELDLSEEDDIILTFDDGLTASIEAEETNGVESTKEMTPVESKPQEEAKSAAEKIATPKREKKLKSAFSLNDRFLYARELFGGNLKMFDSALDFIEGVDDYNIIEDYFFNEMEWDAENATVQSFMEILRGRL